MSGLDPTSLAHVDATLVSSCFLAGNLGSQLVEYKEEMYITSDCGNTWRQVGNGSRQRHLEIILMHQK